MKREPQNLQNKRKEFVVMHKYTSNINNDEREWLRVLACDVTPIDEANDAEWFVSGTLTTKAVRLYIEGLLVGHALQCVETALIKPENRDRVERMREGIEARKRALLQTISGSSQSSSTIIDFQTSALGLDRIFEPEVMSCAASEIRGGTVHTNDEKALVTLVVTEHLLGEQGVLDIEVFTRRDPRLIDVDGEFQVLEDGVLTEAYPIAVRRRRFRRRFGFQKRNITSDRIKFRLFLHLA